MPDGTRELCGTDGIEAERSNETLQRRRKGFGVNSIFRLGFMPCLSVQFENSALYDLLELAQDFMRRRALSANPNNGAIVKIESNIAYLPFNPCGDCVAYFISNEALRPL